MHTIHSLQSSFMKTADKTQREYIKTRNMTSKNRITNEKSNV